MPGDLIPQPHGGALRPPWAPGERGNSRGPHRGLAGRVQRKCGKDGRKLVDGLFALAFGTQAERLKVFGEDVEVTAKDRREAIQVLLDRGWGRPFVPEDDMPALGDGAPQIFINIPRPPNVLAQDQARGMKVVTGLFQDEEPKA